MFCFHCGSFVEDGLKFCTSCGTPTEAGGQAPQSEFQPQYLPQPDFQPQPQSQPDFQPQPQPQPDFQPQYLPQPDFQPQFQAQPDFQQDSWNNGDKTEILKVGGQGMSDKTEYMPDSGNQTMFGGQGNIPVYDINQGVNKNSNAKENKKKGSTAAAIIILVISVIIAAAAVGVTFYLTSPSVKAGKELSLGQKYLEDAEYDEAIASFERAIALNPENEDAYLGLADVYVEMDDYESAIAVLEDGYEATESDAIKEKLDELTEEYESAVEERRIQDEALAAEEEKARKEAEEAAAAAAAEAAERARQEELDAYFRNIPEGYEVGQMMPDFAMKDENGAIVYLSDYKGQVLYLNFFTTWCPYCDEEFPDMANLDCKVLLVDLEETPQEVRNYMSQYGFNFEVNYLPDWRCGNFEIEAVPTTFVIDEYGIIRAYRRGMADSAWMNSAVQTARTAIYDDVPSLR